MTEETRKAVDQDGQAYPLSADLFIVGDPTIASHCPFRTDLLPRQDSVQLGSAGAAQPGAPPLLSHGLRIQQQVGNEPLGNVITYRVTGGPKPVVLHALTEKGRGYGPAEQRPAAFHGVSPVQEKTPGQAAAPKAKSYSDEFCAALLRLAALVSGHRPHEGG